jgi:hypothetical protein
MNPQRHTGQKAQHDPQDASQEMGMEGTHREKRKKEADHKAEQAARSVMHPESYDPEWRYYHGAWGG